VSFNLSGEEGSDGDDFQLRPVILHGGDGVGDVDLLNTESTISISLSGIRDLYV
jgi:hypothetical protein